MNYEDLSEEFVNSDFAKKKIIFKTSIGEVYFVSALYIAYDCAKIFSPKYNNDIETTLREYVIPRFSKDDYKIKEWLIEHVSWEDASVYAIPLLQASCCIEEEWKNPEFIKIENPILNNDVHEDEIA